MPSISRELLENLSAVSFPTAPGSRAWGGGSRRENEV